MYPSLIEFFLRMKGKGCVEGIKFLNSDFLHNTSMVLNRVKCNWFVKRVYTCFNVIKALDYDLNMI